jgi:hypothetical protein
MNDKELLELAAKAAGIDVWTDIDGAMYCANKNDSERKWNPLTDDGDALRLAVKLGLTICNEHESAGAVCCTRAEGEDFPVVESGAVGDPPGITNEDYAATRRAIVRTAAEIGRNMK